MNPSKSWPGAQRLLLSSTHSIHFTCRRSFQFQARLLSASSTSKSPGQATAAQPSTTTSTSQSSNSPTRSNASTPKSREQSAREASLFLADSIRQMGGGLSATNPSLMRAPELQPATPLELWQRAVKDMERDLHLAPRTGRTLTISRPASNELSLRLGQLQALSLGNRIPQEFRQQKFHERPGLKRKRLVKQRWRKRFRTKFSAIAQRVRDLSAKGW